MVIYKITNLVNNKIYIGQTIQKNPMMRWYSHLADARRGKKSYLLDSIRKHGVENFLWEVIDHATSLDDLNTKEEYWLNYYRDQDIIAYNNRNAGGNKTHSSESIKRMRAAQKLRHATTKVGGWKRKDGGGMKGKSHPRKGTKGLWHYSDEQKKAQSDRMRVLNGTRGKSWKLVDGKRVYFSKEISN
jgi:group I intron endonuclease